MCSHILYVCVAVAYEMRSFVMVSLSPQCCSRHCRHVWEGCNASVVRRRARHVLICAHLKASAHLCCAVEFVASNTATRRGTHGVDGKRACSKTQYQHLDTLTRHNSSMHRKRGYVSIGRKRKRPNLPIHDSKGPHLPIAFVCIHFFLYTKQLFMHKIVHKEFVVLFASYV
jgi:hypothetical protein